MIEFKWNGIKESSHKLVRCSYSDGELINHPAGTLTIYAKDYGTDGHFGPQMRAAFVVQNDTDTQTDYFETDRIRVVPTHPLYDAVKAAMEAHKAHRARINQRRNGNAQAMRDLGLVRARGALGGTYWE